MSRLLLLVLLLAPAALFAQSTLAPAAPVEPPTSAQAREGGVLRGAVPFDCGDLAYDDGSPEDAIFFGGGQAGESDHFLGVRFELADFGIPPGGAALSGFCIANTFDFSAVGGPWPNEVFVYRDLDGVPDLDNPVRRATVVTGDGSGQVEVEFDDPWMLDEPVFWILVQGDPIHAGEDFNVESDQSSEPAGRSWIADRGIPFMIPTEQNFMIRATILGLPGNVTPVPALGRTAVLMLGLLLGLVGLIGLRRGRLDARRG